MTRGLCTSVRRKMPAQLRKKRDRDSPNGSECNTAQTETVRKEKACMLCRRIQVDTHICGDKRVRFRLCVHTYCQIFASGLYPQEKTGEYLFGDTRRIIREAAKKTCFICNKTGATITCCQMGCERAFHLPCAPDGQCVTQYFGAYRSFCWEHSPQQKLQPRPRQDNTCGICLGTVEDKISYKTMGCPACQDAYFHRQCIQSLALHTALSFQCPRCLNQEPFRTEMLTMGIRLTERLAFLLPAHKASGTSTVPGSTGKPELTFKRAYPEEESDPGTSYGPPAKHRRIDNGPAHSAEACKPSTSRQAASQLSQGKCPIKSGSSSSCPRQAVKRAYPEEESDPGTSYGPPAKHRRIDNGPAHSAEACKPSTSRQAASQLSQGKCPIKSGSSSSCPRQAVKRAYPEEESDPGTSTEMLVPRISSDHWGCNSRQTSF
ncbi:PHD finger protein 7-like [Chamaea fasciata]|uniref:PHD finger protein 7-like n=1 Tax=Chamaea fasciata TaxID=190680 RepID=UPI00336AC064